MLTGNILRPAQKTNTIAKNAEILGDYIAHVKAETGAEQVDLVVHSMGGLISRFYIDRYMSQRDVAQLIMLGTPNGGSDCAVLPGTLGFYQPAALELRSSYLRDVFNPQILDTREVPFYMIAGVPIQRRILSPCGEVPNDMVVSLASALTIPAELAEVPLLHTELNASEAIYLEFVAPLLRKSPQDFAQGQTLGDDPDASDPASLQFSQTLTGTVTANSESRHTIHIDRDVAVASFGLFDPTRSLTVTVQGASGNQIDLNPDDHGLAVITDPEVLLYLGYGFENPRPGPWVVTVHATSRTPPTGADYALFTLYSGGADIRATLSNHLPSIESPVQLTATLQLGGEPVVFEQAEVVVHHPDGRPQYIPIAGGEEVLRATVQPPLPGIYGIDVSMSSTLEDGTVLARTAYLAFEAFITPPGGRD
jgi:pimeloyl-ACP methyl ester carboxylesterase